jgi:chromosome segregation ATPase
MLENEKRVTELTIECKTLDHTCHEMKSRLHTLEEQRIHDSRLISDFEFKSQTRQLELDAFREKIEQSDLYILSLESDKHRLEEQLHSLHKGHTDFEKQCIYLTHELEEYKSKVIHLNGLLEHQRKETHDLGCKLDGGRTQHSELLLRIREYESHSISVHKFEMEISNLHSNLEHKDSELKAAWHSFEEEKEKLADLRNRLALSHKECEELRIQLHTFTGDRHSLEEAHHKYEMLVKMYDERNSQLHQMTE